MFDHPVIVTDHDLVRVVTINRPERGNSITDAVAEAIATALDELDRRADLRAAVITGAGANFCTGMDLQSFQAGERGDAGGRGFGGICTAPSTKPVVAAVEGYALAGGFELVLACDLVVAARGARFGLPEVTRGLVALAGGVLRLPSRVPRNVAAEMALTGNSVDAARAYELGLVNQVVPDGRARAHALEVAAKIAENAPLAVQASQWIMRHAPEWDPREALDLQADIGRAVAGSHDAAEGVASFLERRAPQWEGH